MLPSTVDVPDIREYQVRNYVAPVGNSVVTVLEQIPLSNGAGLMFAGFIWSRDVAVVADWRTTVIEQGFRVFGGALGTITALRLASTTAGGAGTFSADVTFVAVSLTGGGRLELVAINGAGAPLTGNIMVRWWTKRCAWG